MVEYVISGCELVDIRNVPPLFTAQRSTSEQTERRSLLWICNLTILIVLSVCFLRQVVYQVALGEMSRAATTTLPMSNPSHASDSN